MKLIKVDSCGNCPLCDKQYWSIHSNVIGECQHQAMEDMLIDDLSIIHPDCPLEDDGYVNLLKSLLRLHGNMARTLDNYDSAELRRLLGIMEQALEMALNKKEETQNAKS